MKNRQYITLFYPIRFDYLTKDKKISYHGVNLKTSKLLDLMHYMIIKCLFSKKARQTDILLYSRLLIKNYTHNYKKYIDYLIENKFISLAKNYLSGKNSNTYRINLDDIYNITKIKISDKKIIEKHEKQLLEYANKMTIPEEIIMKLYNDLFSVEIDYDESIKYIETFKKDDLQKYIKNYISIVGISEKYLRMKVDNYGRIHTNFTNLKKHIRSNFIKIDGESVDEVDIQNSQPLFLANLILNEKEILIDFDKPDVKKYFWLVKEGLFYENFENSYPNVFKDRKDIKKSIFVVFFGSNIKNSHNKIFEKEFPTIYNFILMYKKKKKDYRSLSHTLQKIESNFIYNIVVNDLMNNYPHIKMITIHDSIIFQSKYINLIKPLFEKHVKSLLS